MSVLIKGMEMPTSCSKCKLFGEYGCPFIGAVGYALTRNERNDDCPLVPVPPHGRLIDADALINHLRFTMKHRTFKGYTAQRCREIIVELSLAPTIIPAEEGE